MGTEPLPFFLARVREWWTVADALRRSGVPESDPALRVWREAAWCHLLFADGHHRAAVRVLRRAVVGVTGVALEATPPPGNEDEALAVAVDLFARLRAAVGATYPGAFTHPSAA